MMEVVPSAGRLLQPADDQPGADTGAVIRYRAWRDRFQGRTDIAATSVTLNGIPATIVGVAPRGFYGDMLRPDALEREVRRARADVDRRLTPTTVVAASIPACRAATTDPVSALRMD